IRTACAARPAPPSRSAPSARLPLSRFLLLDHDRLATPLADALLGVLFDAVRDPRGLTAVRADHHDLPQGQAHGLVDDPALLVLGRVGLGVAFADVHAGDDDLARGTVDLLHLATLAAIAAGDDDHLVALADAQIARHYSTCSISRLRRGDTLRAGWTRSPRQSRFSLVFIGPPARARRSS